jgi:hypothetical protein
MKETRNAYKIFASKPEGKKPLSKPRHIRNGNVKMDLNEIG